MAGFEGYKPDSGLSHDPMILVFAEGPTSLCKSEDGRPGHVAVDGSKAEALRVLGWTAVRPLPGRRWEHPANGSGKGCGVA